MKKKKYLRAMDRWLLRYALVTERLKTEIAKLTVVLARFEEQERHRAK